MRYLLSLSLALLGSTIVVAAPVASIAPEARLEPSKSQSFTISLTPEQVQHKLALSLLARLDCPTLAGSTFVMPLVLNGKPLGPDRLLNKPLETEMQSGLQLDWFGQASWRVAYSPDYEAANRTDNPACLIGGHAYDFVLDVSDLLQVGDNKLTVGHNEPGINNALVLKDVELVDAPERVQSTEQVEDPNAPLKLIRPTDRSRVQYKLATTDTGALRLSCGKSTVDINSAFSYPNAGWNTLGGTSDQPEPQWRAQVSAGKLTAAGQYYRLTRTITRLPDHVAIRDDLTNLTDTDLHLSLKHSIVTSTPRGDVYLRGMRSRMGDGSQRGGDNPTVFVCSGNDGVGLVAEDDVFRVQTNLVANANPAEAGFVDHFFMLPPRGSYAIRWSIYPVTSGDYFDFVNAVRRNWNTNFTIPGPFAFAPHPTHEPKLIPDLKAWIDDASLNVVSLQIPMPEPAVLSHGLAFLEEKAEQQRLKDQADCLRAAKPGLKVLQYLHTYITRLDSAVEKYKDARHLDANGQQLAYSPGSWKPTFWLFLPTTTNAYGRDMNKTFDLVLDGLAFDGVYWDELAYSMKDIAYGIHDGYSALPNLETMTVQEKVALTPLYCQDYQVQQAKRVLNAGKMLIGNGQPLTETMTELHFTRFIEAWHPGSLRTAHLYTPVGLCSPDRIQSEADIVPNIRAHLENGGLWYYYIGWHLVSLTHPTITAHIFPFTPIELHQGYLIGKERILTARSGQFGWGDRSRHRVFVYGKDGLEIKDHPAPLKTVNRCTYTELRLPAGAVAAIERLP